MQGLETSQNKPLSLRETGMKSSRNPLQKGVLHKDEKNHKSSLSLTKSVNQLFLTFLAGMSKPPAIAPGRDPFGQE